MACRATSTPPPGKTLQRPWSQVRLMQMAATRVQLCGPLTLELAGREVAPPGRQGRLVVAYLVVNRHRPVSREALIDVPWPSDPPADPGEALSALLSHVRRALGADVLPLRQLALQLPDDAYVDLEAA